MTKQPTQEGKFTYPSEQSQADATEMTVKLRPGMMWSDGVEFSAT